MLQINECPLFGLVPGKFFFHSTLGNLTQRPCNMGESQHELLIKIGNTQKVAKLCWSGRGCPIWKDMDIS